MLRVTLARRAVAEAVGTALLLATVVGSGIMGARLSQGLDALALLANALATGAGLFALIFAFGPISGAHLNPVVTLTETFVAGFRRRDVPVYVTAQVVGAIGGVLLAHVMFNEPLWQVSTHVRTGTGQLVSEAVATFGLVSLIGLLRTAGLAATAGVVALYIVSAYWFTASTSFANPAVTLARALTNTFAGIRPADVAPFVAAQGVGGTVAALFVRWLWGTPAVTYGVLTARRAAGDR